MNLGKGNGTDQAGFNPRMLQQMQTMIARGFEKVREEVNELREEVHAVPVVVSARSKGSAFVPDVVDDFTFSQFKEAVRDKYTDDYLGDIVARCQPTLLKFR